MELDFPDPAECWIRKFLPSLLDIRNHGIFCHKKSSGWSFFVWFNQLLVFHTEDGEDNLLLGANQSYYTEDQALEGCYKVHVLFGKQEMESESICIDPSKTVSFSYDLYPDPVAVGGKVSIKCNFKVEDATIEIYNMLGVKVFRGQFNAKSGSDVEIPYVFKNAGNYYLKLAVAEGKIDRNPFDQISASDKIHGSKSTREYLTEEELKKLAQTPTDKEETQQIYLFMCFTGLRISDVKALKWMDIEKDGERWQLRIRQQKTQTPLYLPLSEQAKKFIPEQGKATDDDLVFANIPSEQAMNRQLKDWTKAAGIKKILSLHTARHTFATLTYTKSGDIYTVSKLLGHADIQTTQVYAKIVDKKKEEAVDMLNDILD